MLAAQNAARARAKAALAQGPQKTAVAKKSADTSLFGLEQLDEPLDIDGMGYTWRDRTRSVFLTFMILKEQLTGARTMVQSIVFFVYLGIFTTVALGALKGEQWFDHHDAIRKAVSEREWRFEDSQVPKFFQDVQTTKDFWAWMQGPFLANVIPRKNDLSNWERGGNRSGYFNMNLNMLGPVRLRQLRVRSDSCVVPEEVLYAVGDTEEDIIVSEQLQQQHHLFSRTMGLHAYVSPCKEPWPGCGNGVGGIGDDPAAKSRGKVGEVAGCYSEVTDLTEAKEGFGPVENANGSDALDRFIWRWESADSLQEGKYYGRSSVWYPGSGYIIIIEPDTDSAESRLKYLQEERWIDLSTRVLFLDFIVYSPNVGFVTLVKLSVEFRPGGSALTFVLLRSVDINQILWTPDSTKDLLPEALLLVMVIMYIMYELWDMWRTGPLYLLNGWHHLALLNYIIFLAGFGMRLTPYAEIRELGFPPPPGQYINYDHTFWASQQWRNCLAVNCVLVWLRSFQHLSFIPYMTRLIQILLNAMVPLLTVVIVFSGVLFSFSLAFLLAFGNGVYEFRNLSMALINTFRTLRGPDYFEDMWEENRLLGPLFFFSWTIIGAFVLVNLFVVVLLDSFGTLEAFSIEAFLMNVVRTYKMLLGGRPREEAADPSSTNVYDASTASMDSDAVTVAGLRLQHKLDHVSESKVKKTQAQAAEEVGIPKLLRLLIGTSKRDSATVEVTEERFASLEQSVQDVSSLVAEISKRWNESEEGEQSPLAKTDRHTKLAKLGKSGNKLFHESSLSNSKRVPDR